MVEVYIAIIVSCMPAFAGFARTYIGQSGFYKSLTSLLRSRNNTPGNSAEAFEAKGMPSNTKERTGFDDTTGLDPYWIPNRGSETGFFTPGDAEDGATEGLESGIVKTLQVEQSYETRWDQSEGQKLQHVV